MSEHHPLSVNSAAAGILRSAGVSEGFYRRAFPGATTSPKTTTTPMSPTSAGERHRRSLSAPDTQAMDRSDSRGGGTRSPTNLSQGGTLSPMGGAGAGSLMPPGELGHDEVSHSESNLCHSLSQNESLSNGAAAAHPGTIRARQRMQRAIRRATSPSTNTFQQFQAGAKQAERKKQVPPSKLTTLTYRGMAVVFCTVTRADADDSTTRTSCYGMCARTQLVFQRLDIKSPSEPVVAIESNADTGQIVIAQADGMLQTFFPQEVDPKEFAFGQYRWVDGPSINVKDIFYQSNEAAVDVQPAVAVFKDASTAKIGERLDLSLSHNYKLLVAHKKQIAVFEARSSVASDSSITENAELLWTTRLPGNLVTAKLSGDAECIALVVSPESEDDSDAPLDLFGQEKDDGGGEGVYTFVRDQNDGSDVDAQSSDLSRSPLTRSRSVGIVYKPGPFLVHASRVTQLSFRGQGHTTSNVDKSKEQGCDLLLTYCADGCTARIFNQNNWRPLTEWITPVRTRVEWINGTTAFALGDLEHVKKHKNQLSAPPSRRPSGSSEPGTDKNNNAADESTGKRTQHYHQSIPNTSTTPLTNAGAWIVEVSFEDVPTLRVSRLAYLKRGVDDLDPTLFENVATFLPTGTLSPTTILGTDSAALSVEGVWPAWNPWVAESSDRVSNETLRGSAMAYLGLSSGPPVSAGGHFGGDTLFGNGNQCPPSELRVVAAHPSSGKLVALEFCMLADLDDNSLELGAPRTSLLDFAHFDTAICPKARESNKSPVKASTRYECSHLIAEVDGDTNTVSVTWRRQGALSLLPSAWLPEDASDFTATERLLAENRRLKDESLLSAPLMLPNVNTSYLTEGSAKGQISTLLWWLDENFGGPPLLVVVTSVGTITVFELPPPWSTQNPLKLRTDDTAPKSPRSVRERALRAAAPSGLASQQQGESGMYVVQITPDPEYGLGLRLEVQADGMPAIAGSYKKHPLTGETLPAEKTGMITLGDELVAANDVPLENKTFDDIIATVRDLGASCGPGSPMRLKFRRVASSGQAQALLPTPVSMPSKFNSPSPRRRTIEDILGVRTTRTPSGYTQPGLSTDQPDNLDDCSIRNGGETHVVAYFDNALKGSPQAQSCEHACLVPFMWFEEEGVGSRQAIVFIAGQDRVSAVMLTVDASHEPDKARILGLGVWQLPCSSDSHLLPKSMEVVHSLRNRYHVIVADSTGTAHLMAADVDRIGAKPEPSLSFQHFPIFKLCNAGPSSDLLLRVCGIELVGTMDRSENGTSDEIQVWSVRLHPGCTLADGVDDPLSPDYASQAIRVDAVAPDDTFVDFEFALSGFLDSSPLLVACLRKQAVLFTKTGRSKSWLPTQYISYSSLPGSVLRLSGSNSFGAPLEIVPRMAFPHLMDAVQMAYASKDEKDYLRADWHPEALLAHLFADSRGPMVSMNDRVLRMLRWLCAEGSNIPEDYGGGPLVVAPLVILDGTDGSPPVEASSPSLGLPRLAVGKLSFSAEEESLHKLREVLARSSSLKPTTACAEIPRVLTGDNGGFELPPILQSAKVPDLAILKTVCEAVLEPPNFASVDKSGERFLLSMFLLDRLKPPPKLVERTEGTSSLFTAPGVRARKATSIKQPQPVVQIAPSASLAALTSNKQSVILDQCKQQGKKLDWERARELRLPFWVRSDAHLARLSEEMGQNLFRETRDIMDCALFFIIARKMRTLRNLAATDHSESGQKFFKFITSYDFSSDRGRRAADKNAFSLLRKCQYRVAAAFFLLAKPPSLTSAVETIATKLEDPDLAFLVARLMESKELDSCSDSALGDGGGGFGGVLGGGGGYAAGAIVSARAAPQDAVFYESWKPVLGSKGRKLLVDRTLPMAVSCPSLVALQMIWLNRKEEAAWCMSGIVRPDKKGTSYSIAQDASEGLWLSDARSSSKDREELHAVDKANDLIDILSAPNVLRAIGASDRVRFACTFALARRLSGVGIELPSMELTLTQITAADHGDGQSVVSVAEMSLEAATSRAGDRAPQSQKSLGAEGQAQSSIFDSFDIPPKPKAPVTPAPAPAPSGAMQSSIFDSFDPVPRPNETPAPAPAGSLQSSIFDSFDPVPKPNATPAPAPAPFGSMQSSIFDSFDPVSKPNATPAPAPAPSGALQSSIFDSFDPVPKPKATPAPAPAPSDAMQSSIFDSVDPLPKPKATPAPAPAPSGAMQSSLFDSFDVPQRPKPKSDAPRTNGTMNSSIFDSYDVPVQARNGSASGQMQSSAPKPQHAELKSPSCRETPLADVPLSITGLPIPKLWTDWSRDLLEATAARRLIREIASILARFHGDPTYPSIEEFYRRDEPLVPPGASGILQIQCNAKDVFAQVAVALEELCKSSKVESDAIVHCALRLLGAVSHRHRTLFAVILHLGAGRGDFAEDIVRSTAFDLLQECNGTSLECDSLASRRQTRAQVSTQFLRRRAARLSWQLETCLWLHRGGGLPLSGIAVKEAVAAVRVGLIIASWNHNHDCMATMIRSEPDCQVDEEAGRMLWTSVKLLSSNSDAKSGSQKASSGGWEFLVDCRRSEATQMLRDKKTGCFIIRPHSGDHGVFTLSFKTNLVPSSDNREAPERNADASSDEDAADIESPSAKPKSKTVKKDDVVQHAIIRLSESGYRCGSFGPFTTLISLLEAVSASLPFKLRFDEPPSNRIIREDGSQPSPNAVLLRKLALNHADSLVSCPPSAGTGETPPRNAFIGTDTTVSPSWQEREKCYGLLLELLTLSSLRKQLSAVVAAECNDYSFEAQTGDSGEQDTILDRLADSLRFLRPLLSWCKSLELLTACEMLPDVTVFGKSDDSFPVDLTKTEDAIECTESGRPMPQNCENSSDNGDSVLRRMIQRDSGIEFSTLRLVDGGECTLVIMFNQSEAVQWLVSTGLDDSDANALKRLEHMETRRVIEAIDMSTIALRQKGASDEAEGIRYRILDPWEVEALRNWKGETLGASIGRERFVGFNLGKVGQASEGVFRSLGGLEASSLWTTTKGGVVLTRALASAHPFWERPVGGDLQFKNGHVTEPPPFDNSIRRHLYRNALFRHLGLPQRFLAIMQVELLDLKNLTAPGGSLAMSVYALLRLKRPGSSTSLTNKTRTLDTAGTTPVKLGKTSGPNAPASWGSVVRFRFPLPEHASVDGVSYNKDREQLFKGPACVLQVSVYERKLLVDHALGTADIRTDGLWSGGQIEEWVPLRSDKHGITWFARIRLTLRYELMCIATNDDMGRDLKSVAPSVGLRRIQELSQSGGAAHEDVKRSMSSPDLLTYFESMVY